jgi:Helix-turn-helix domain of resolvase
MQSSFSDDIEAARALLANPDIGVTQIAHRLGVYPATLYRYIPPPREPRTREPRTAKGFLFRTSCGHGEGAFQSDDDAARSLAHDPPARYSRWHSRPIGNHSFRATEIMAYLANGGALEHAALVYTMRQKVA